MKRLTVTFALFSLLICSVALGSEKKPETISPVPLVWVMYYSPVASQAELDRQKVLIDLGAREFVQVAASPGFVLFFRIRASIIIPDPGNPFDYQTFAASDSAAAIAEYQAHPQPGTGIVSAGSGEILIVWWRR